MTSAVSPPSHRDAPSAVQRLPPDPGRDQPCAHGRSLRPRDGMQAKWTIRNTGSPSGDRGVDQLAARERQAGPFGMAELAQRLERTAHLLQRSAGSGGMFAPGPPGPG